MAYPCGGENNNDRVANIIKNNTGVKFARNLSSGEIVEQLLAIQRDENIKISNLVFMGIKPGYLFQTDLAEGTSHFRVPLEKGKELYLALKNELSGLSLPIYAVDLPGGGGKVNIMATNFVKEGQNWKTIDGNGKEWFYPV